MLYNEHLIPNLGFSYESAQKLINSISATKTDPEFISDLRHCFVVSKMTNLEDLSHSEKYECLLYVEFLECLCRVSISYWDREIEEGRGQYSPPFVEDKVYSILEMLWAHRKKHKPKVDKKKKAKKKKKEFPELVEIQDLDDSDE